MSRTIQANRAVIAELAASAFAQHAIEVVLEDEPTRTFISTPAISNFTLEVARDLAARVRAPGEPVGGDW